MELLLHMAEGAAWCIALMLLTMAGLGVRKAWVSDRQALSIYYRQRLPLAATVFAVVLGMLIGAVVWRVAT